MIELGFFFFKFYFILEYRWLTMVCVRCISKVIQLSIYIYSLSDSFPRSVQFSSVAQSLSRVWLFVTPWIAAFQASLSITNSWSLPRLMPIESVMPSSHLILCCPLLFLPPIPPSIRVFSSELTLHMSWPKYWSFSFSISPSNEHPGLISFRMNWLDLLAVQGTLKSLLHTTVQKHQLFDTQLSFFFDLYLVAYFYLFIFF